MIQQRVRSMRSARQRHDDARRRDVDLRIARDRVDDVRGHERRAVPVAGLVLRGREDEIGRHGTIPSVRRRVARDGRAGEHASRARERGGGIVALAAHASRWPHRRAPRRTRERRAIASMRSRSSESSRRADRGDASSRRAVEAARARAAVRRAAARRARALDGLLSLPLRRPCDVDHDPRRRGRADRGAPPRARAGSPRARARMKGSARRVRRPRDGSSRPTLRCTPRAAACSPRRPDSHRLRSRAGRVERFVAESARGEQLLHRLCADCGDPRVLLLALTARRRAA